MSLKFQTILKTVVFIWLKMTELINIFSFSLFLSLFFYSPFFKKNIKHKSNFLESNDLKVISFLILINFLLILKLLNCLIEIEMASSSNTGIWIIGPLNTKYSCEHGDCNTIFCCSGHVQASPLWASGLQGKKNVTQQTKPPSKVIYSGTCKL